MAIAKQPNRKPTASLKMIYGFTISVRKNPYKSLTLMHKLVCESNSINPEFMQVYRTIELCCKSAFLRLAITNPSCYL